MKILRIFMTVFTTLSLNACGGGQSSEGQPPLTNIPPTPGNVGTCIPTVNPTQLQLNNAQSQVVLKDISTCSGSTRSLQWSLVSKPVGSRSVIDSPNDASINFYPDVAGTYFFRLKESSLGTAENTLILVSHPSGTSTWLSAHSVISDAYLTRLPISIKSSMNNQGLAYRDGYYYVGYDVTGGKGMIERFTASGILDSTYGGLPIPTRHTAELAFRAADGRLYAVSGGGTEPTYVYRIAADGKAVDATLDFTSLGNSALMAFDNTNDLLLLVSNKIGGDKGNPTFRFIDLNNNNRVIMEFSAPYQGVPQGLETHGGIIYLYTDNTITLFDFVGNIIDRKTTRETGESQGMTLVDENGKKALAIGYQPGRVFTVR